MKNATFFEIWQLRIGAENSRFHSKFRVFEKEIKRFREI